MNYKIKHHSLSELVSLLEERGITVDDKDILKKINYSHLMYKYGQHFLIETDDKSIRYKKGTKLSNIYNMHKLNVELCSIIFKGINKLEHIMRSVLANRLSETDAFGYLKPDFYTNEKESLDVKNGFYSGLFKTELYSRYKYDEKYWKQKGMLPIWLLIDELPIGQLRMFARLINGMTKPLLDSLGIREERKYLLGTINEYRNLISHGGKLSPVIIKNKRKYNFVDLFIILKREAPKITIEFLDEIDNWSNKTKIDKKMILDYLKI